MMSSSLSILHRSVAVVIAVAVLCERRALLCALRLAQTAWSMLQRMHGSGSGDGSQVHYKRESAVTECPAVSSISAGN